MNRLYALFKRIHNDSLYRNAIFLMLSTFVMAGVGFFFWTICTRLYSTEDIGLATTLISISALITNFSLFGFNSSLIRFLPAEKDKSKLINTAFAVISITAIIFSLIFFIGLPIFSPRLTFLGKYPLFIISFTVFMVISTLNTITDSIFISEQKTHYILIYNTILSVIKLIMPIILVSWGAYGIFYGYITAIEVTLILSFIFLARIINYNYRPIINPDALKKMWKYSFGNHMAGFVAGIPGLVLPIIITNKLGTSYTAYFYMAFMIANVVFIVPSAVTQSLFAEVSRDEKIIHAKIIQAFKLLSLFLIPIIVTILLLGKDILLIFGESYSQEGFVLLQLLTISAIFSSVNSVYSTILRLKKQLVPLISMCMLSTFLTLFISYINISKGLLSVGIAWFCGQGAVSFLILGYAIIRRINKYEK